MSAHHSNFILRAAEPEDASTLFSLIQDLATYEKLSHQVVGNAQQLASHLGGDRPLVEAVLAEQAEQALGFALFFHNYSTFLTQPGIYLEDLFVLPDHRRRGIGKALITHLAKLAVERNCGRLEWSVLDWNELAIAFYEKIGATVLPDWRICRTTGAALDRMAAIAIPFS
jgi:GNAT superfamily N-acetyltransferase